MADVLLLLTMLVVCGGIGLPVAYLLPERFAWRVAIAPALGVALLSIVVPVVYRLGVPLHIVFYALIPLALAGIALHARRAARDIDMIVAAGWLAVTLLLLLPSWIGGQQFSVFQGNPWDTFAYLESALSYARKPHDFLQHVNDQQLARFPIFAIAQGQLYERPSVHMLYATFSRVSPGEAYRLYYAFLVFFIAQGFLVTAFAVRAMVREASVLACLAIAAVFPLGFWGQYVLDLNAWSQVASAPLLVLMFALLMHVAAGERSWRITVVLATLVAGSVYLYPEGFIIYAAAAFTIAGSLALWRMLRARKLDLAALLPLTSFAAIAVTVLYMPVLRFLLKQVTWGKSARVAWWEFFQGFFQGRDASWASGAKVDFTAGVFGLYFATPTADSPLALVQRLAIAIVILGLVAAVALVLARRVEVERDTHALLVPWTLATALALLPALYLWRTEAYWPAGKVLAYVAPVLLVLLCVPIAFRFSAPLVRPLRWIAIGFVGFQLALGVVRIAAARDPDGIFYAPPYPIAGFKHDIPFDVSALDDHIRDDMHVVIAPTHMWLEHRLMTYLFARRIAYVRPGVVNTYFGDGRNLEAPGPPWPVDVEISLDQFTLVLRFPTSGKPEVRLPLRPDLR